jgi:undecaprenyl-diphosphatase
VAGLVAAKAAGHTAQLAAAVGLLAWLLAARGPRLWRAAVWGVAGSYVAVCAGCWVYLGWSRTSETVAAVLIGAAWAVLNAAIWSAPPAAGGRRFGPGWVLPLGRRGVRSSDARPVGASPMAEIRPLVAS